MAASVDAAAAEPAAQPVSRTSGNPLLRTKLAISDANRLYADSLSRRRSVLNIATGIAAVVSASFAVIELTTSNLWQVALVDGVTAVMFALIPLLHRYGEFVAPIALVCTAQLLMVVVTWRIGTHAGFAFLFLTSVLVAVLVLGIEHFVAACIVVAISAALMITMRVIVPIRIVDQPEWAGDVGFGVSVIATCVMIVATVWYALHEIERARDATQREYERSESLLANILPASVAARLKNPSTTIIADKYDDASVLFADVAGYTERASRTPPADLVEFLNRFYSEFDSLVERHGLEKVKTTGDSYMAVSGLPQHRSDHLEALARLAIDLADAASRLTDLAGQKVAVRIGLGVGPVVAGVVGTRRFFYDVWGDAVNVASRMESTSMEGRIQVPQEVYERLKVGFTFEERGTITVKGKGVLHTWFLVGPRASDAVADGRPVPAEHQ